MFLKNDSRKIHVVTSQRTAFFIATAGKLKYYIALIGWTI
jgi:hypothetical protein